MEIARDGQPTLTLERDKDKKWALAKGDGKVNQTNAQSLVNTLATLRAVRWLGTDRLPWLYALRNRLASLADRLRPHLSELDGVLHSIGFAPESALEIAERLRGALCAPYRIGHRDVVVSASIGLARPAVADDADSRAMIDFQVDLVGHGTIGVTDRETLDAESWALSHFEIGKAKLDGRFGTVDVD